LTSGISTGREVVECRRCYASVGSKVIAEKEDKSFIESDVEKLCKYVCINFYIQGEEPGPKILPDSEYPQWLPPRPLEDLDPDVDGWLYWRELRRVCINVRYKTRYVYLVC
uniref:Uncharacterized protein n=1 Tax=Parascaris equorum TaxID=6256 RepID=A0A914REV7_PAREQ